MTITAFLTLLPMLLGMTTVAAPADEPRVRSLVVQDQLIMRIPVRPPTRQFEWTELEGPKCINARAIRGAFLSGSDSVDFITVRRRRFRAELSQDCPALDFYDVFYLKPEDHRICAERDVIRSRMGGSCQIERFHYLVPKPRR
ncbi:MAG: hypothetical protein ACR2JJ_08965 [Sphingomicrobium sp.]